MPMQNERRRSLSPVSENLAQILVSFVGKINKKARDFANDQPQAESIPNDSDRIFQNDPSKNLPACLSYSEQKQRQKPKFRTKAQELLYEKNKSLMTRRSMTSLEARKVLSQGKMIEEELTGIKTNKFKHNQAKSAFKPIRYFTAKKVPPKKKPQRMNIKVWFEQGARHRRLKYKFGRGAYHVAIGYGVHIMRVHNLLTQNKRQGFTQDMMKYLDPLYHHNQLLLRFADRLRDLLDDSEEG